MSAKRSFSQQVVGKKTFVFKHSNYSYNMTLKEDYKKREFCNDIKCPVQMEMNKHAEGSSEHNAIKGICSSNCLQSSNNFIIWLNNHDYSIVKDGSADEDKIASIARIENTAWRFHRAINQQGFMIMKKV